MTHDIDLKVYLFTAIALTVSMQDYEMILRFILLTLSIIYTTYKIIDRFKDKDKRNEDVL